MFFDAGTQQSFLIDRISAAGRTLRRVLVVAENTLLVCKLDGIVTRIINSGSITHLIFGSYNGIRGGIVLMRIENERDILFVHPTGVHANVARHAAGFIENLTELRGNAARSNNSPLVVVERNDEALIRSAADLTRRGGEEKPKGFAITEQILTPTLFDSLSIAGDGPLVSEELDLFVDATFINMLTRSIDLHPISASQSPKVVIESPPPFRHLEVSARFFSGFCQAYDRELPLVVNLHSHLPAITSFRATKSFWMFVQKLLQVTRPITSAMNALASDHIEAYVVGEEQYGVTCTVKEWNDAMVQWEMRVRSPEGKDKKLNLMPKDSDLFWQTFVTELERGVLP